MCSHLERQGFQAVKLETLFLFAYDLHTNACFNVLIYNLVIRPVFAYFASEGTFMGQSELLLRKEISINSSGKLYHESKIQLLKQKNYWVINTPLDGDAPKQFIKAYFFTPNSSVRKILPNTWTSFIAKTAEKWYPHESVIEFMINRIGQEMGLHMNDVRLVKANGQIRFLSQYFLKNNEKLVHGAEICGEHLGDAEMAAEIANHKPTARELFTFEFITEAIQSIYPDYAALLLQEIVKMLTFDCIVGNNDRHFYNWGVIDSIKKKQENPKFAPLYDSARGLMWNFSDENIVLTLRDMKKGGKKIDNYISQAKPRISIDKNKTATHFELIEFLKKDKKFAQIIDSLSSDFLESKVIKMLKREFFPFFIKERSELVLYLLKMRFQKTRDLL